MIAFTAYAGPCWRAVPAGCAAAVLAGTDRAGRYNRPGEPALYMSGSPAGVAAAMARYGDAPREVVRLEVTAERLVDLRDATVAAALSAGAPGEDWLAAVGQGRTPWTWAVADRARGEGAIGLLERSRRAPAEWHLVLFRWNQADGARVVVVPGLA